MLKKTRLYSLLLVIALSTVVGVFGIGEKAGAQEWRGNTITYNDRTFTEGVCTSAGEHPLENEGGTIYTNCDDEDAVGMGRIHTIHFADGVDTTEPDASATYRIYDYDRLDRDYTDSYTDEGTLTFSTPRDPNAQDPAADETEEPQYCQIKGIGWLVCPLVVFVAEITDQSYDLLETYLLRLEPMALPGGSGNDAGLQLHNSWKIMRDFANIVFIIGFLFIVFSQTTSIGITNYGIKRLLPKLIIAAILVNISYYICVVAVDLSNILGNSMRGLLMDTSVQSQGGGPFSFQYTPEGSDDEITVTSWEGLTNLILGAGTAVTVMATSAILIAYAPIFLPMVLGAALAILTVVIAMVLRQALVVILVVISPLAFVALLLPNTESYFQKWRSLFVAMLLVYPIVSIIFGASALASRILMATDDFPTQLVGAGVSIIPLFITPVVMKVSGGLLNRWVGLVNDPAKGPVDGLKNNVQKRADRWDAKRNLSSLKGKGNRLYSGRYRRRAKQEAEDAGIQSELGLAKNKYVANEIQDPNSDLQRRVAGDPDDQAAMNRAAARAQFTLTNAQLEDVKAAHATIDHLDGNTISEMLEAGNNSDEVTAAMLERLVQVGSAQQVADAVNQYGGGGQQTVVTKSLAQALQKDGPGWLRAQDIDDVARGQIGATRDAAGNDTGRAGTFEEKTLNNLAAGVMSQSKIVNENGGNIDFATNLAQNAAAAGRPEALNKFAETADAARNNERLKGEIRHNKGAIDRIADSAPPRPAAPAAAAPAAAPAAPAPAREFTREQIRAMGPANTQAATQARGGITAMNDGDLLSIANAHGGSPVGQQARDEAVRRGLISPPPERRGRLP